MCNDGVGSSSINGDLEGLRFTEDVTGRLQTISPSCGSWQTTQVMNSRFIGFHAREGYYPPQGADNIRSLAIIEDDPFDCVSGEAYSDPDPTLTVASLSVFVNGAADTSDLTAITDMYRTQPNWCPTVCEAWTKSVSPAGSVLSLSGDENTLTL